MGLLTLGWVSDWYKSANWLIVLFRELGDITYSGVSEDPVLV